jgi:hypothetical protein
MMEEVFDLHAAVRKLRRKVDEETAQAVADRENEKRGEVLLRLKADLQPEEYQALLLELKPFDTRWKLMWHGTEYLIGIGLHERAREYTIYIAASRDPNNCEWLTGGTDLLLYLSEN